MTIEPRWERRVIAAGAALLGLTSMVAVGAGCKRGEDRAPALPQRMRVAVLPDDAADALRRRHQPLLDHLGAELGMAFDLGLDPSYEAFAERVERDEVDLGYFGGLTFVQARERRGAIPLVARDIDGQFTSYILVREDDPARAVADLRGRRFAFGSRLSTSGYLMPQAFFRAMQIEPERFFSEVRYAGSHDRTVELVLRGDVDAGVANANVVGSMLRDGRLAPGQLRVLWESPPYKDYVWAVSPRIDGPLRSRLLEAFLKLLPGDPGARAILERQGAKFFLPVGTEEFAALRDIARALGLLEAKP